MQQTVSKGLATWAGIVAAIGQYAAAVAVFLSDPDKATAAAPLATATATLLVVIAGRMAQAKAAAARVPPPVMLEPVPYTQTWDDRDPEPPAGPNSSIADPVLDEPGDAREQHSRLNG